MAERNDLTSRTHDDAPDRSAQDIRHDIAAKRETISETVDKLGERIQETLDWREYIAQYPFAALAAAAAAGCLVSGIIPKSRPTPQERISDAVAEMVEDVTGRLRGSLGDVIPGKSITPGKTVKAAATAALTKAAMDYAQKRLKGVFPGNARETRTNTTNQTSAPAYERANFDDADIQVSRATTTTT